RGCEEPGRENRIAGRNGGVRQVRESAFGSCCCAMASLTSSKASNCPRDESRGEVGRDSDAGFCGSAMKTRIAPGLAGSQESVMACHRLFWTSAAWNGARRAGGFAYTRGTVKEMALRMRCVASVDAHWRSCGRCWCGWRLPGDRQRK